MLLFGLSSVTGPVLDTRRLGSVNEPNGFSLMVPLLISARTLLLVGLLIGDEMVILPALLVPMRVTPAVISFNSACVSPRTPPAFTPPRLIACPAEALWSAVAAVPELIPAAMTI